MSDFGHLEAADIARRELRLFLNMAAQPVWNETGSTDRCSFRRMTGTDGLAFCRTRLCRRVLRYRCCCAASAT